MGRKRREIKRVKKIGKRQEDNSQSDDSKKRSTVKNGDKRRSLPLRILFKSLRIVLIWIPACIILLIALSLLTLKLYLSPERVENLIVSHFNEMAYGDVTLKVKDFSPYSGFEIHNLIIRNGEEFSRSKFVEIERLVFRYEFFSMLIGNVRFREIGIYKPRIYLEERRGVWNAARLMKPAEGLPEEEEIEEPIEKPPTKEIHLPISAEFLFKFILEDLRLSVKGSNFSSSVKGLTLNVDVWVPPFKRIPKSIEAVSLLEKMRVELNPREEMDVSFYSRDAEISPPLILTWKLIFDKKRGGKPEFASIFKFGTYKTPVRFKRSHLAPLNFMISYDLYYNPLDDYLKLNHLGVTFRGRRWLQVTGSVKKVMTEQNINLRMTESDIALSDLYPYFLSITGDRKTTFRGSVSLFPLTVRGNPTKMDIDGVINLRKIYFKNQSIEASVPSLELSYSVFKRGATMRILSRLRLPHLFYSLERDRSGDNGLYLESDISAFNNFQRVEINDLGVRYFSPAARRSALSLAMNGNLYLEPTLRGRVKISRFRFMRKPLLDMLPKRFREKIADVPLEKPVDMNLDLSFALGEITRAALGMMVKVPDYNINDLKLGMSVIQDGGKKRITLRSFTLGSRSKGLSISARGTVDLKSPPVSDMNLKLMVSLNSPTMKAIYDPWRIKGDFKLNTLVRGDLKNGKASGDIRIERFFVRNDDMKLAVDDINLAFPFEYYFTPQYRGESRIAVDKSQVIENENFRERENFTIKSVKSKHPARDIQFEYMKDFGATMFFRNNTFEIVKLKAYVLDGALYGRDILFNLADMKPDNMEFRLILDVTNVDIGKMDEPDPAKKSRDAELSLNANFDGMGVDVKKELNIKGFVNIYKIGEEFANRLMKGLSEEKGKSKLGVAQPVVDNFMLPKRFSFNLDKGLVYTTVDIERKTVSKVMGVSIKNDQIKFERIPIQEYLRKVAREEEENK
jgi:hypothetical protein